MHVVSTNHPHAACVHFPVVGPPSVLIPKHQPLHGGADCPPPWLRRLPGRHVDHQPLIRRLLLAEFRVGDVGDGVWAHPGRAHGQLQGWSCEY